MNNFFNNPINPQATRQLQENWFWYLLLGIGLVVFGTLAVIYAWKSTLFSMMYLGIFLVVFGLFEGIQSFKLSQWGSFFMHVLLSILYIIAGIYIAYNPTLSALSLTLFLAIFFVATGILRIVFAATHKLLPHRGWLAINGVCTLILGIILWQQWPVSGLWAIGLLVGIDAIFTGWAWIMLSLFAKKLGK